MVKQVTYESAKLAGEMYGYHSEGHGLQQVGTQFGVSKQYVSELFKKYGYKAKRLPFSKVAGNKRRQEILDFIRIYRSEHSQSPTFAEIAKAITGDRLNAGNLVEHIEKLISEGFLYRTDENTHRVLMLTQPQPRVPYYSEKGAE